MLDDEMADDLSALQPDLPPVNPHDIIGRFFFVHATAANVPAYIQPRKSFDFPHSTFGEYLAAATIVDELVDRAETIRKPRGRGRAPARIDDDMLFALLSRRAVAAQPRTLTFLRDIAGNLSPEVRGNAVATGIRLLQQGLRRSDPGGLPDYRPQEFDVVRDRAAYTVNLVLLLACLGGVRIDDLSPEADDGLPAWQSMVRLWRAGLDEESWQAVAQHLAPAADGSLGVFPQDSGYSAQIHEARLLAHEGALRAGELIHAIGGTSDSARAGHIRRRVLIALAARTKRSRIEATLSYLAVEMSRTGFGGGRDVRRRLAPVH